MSRKRAIVAGLLSVVYPGIGHLYLREWLRAVAWLVVAVATAMLVMPESAVTAFENEGFSGFLEASRDIPTGAFLALFMIRTLNVIDAVWIGLRGDAPVTPDRGTPTCPNCGKELDDDLDFCPWCSAPLSGDPDPDAGESTPDRGPQFE